MKLNQAAAEKIIADMGMDDMPLISVTPRPVPVPAGWFEKYKQARHVFMRSLTDSAEELSFMGLTQEMFMDLLMGRAMPPNTSIRLRIPLNFGGEITPENMFMCFTFPHSQDMDRFIIGQAGNEVIWLPSPARKVYIPTHTGGAGPGGNATEDRLTQMAAQMAAARDM